MSGAISKAPAFGLSSRKAKMVGLSKFGQQRKSTQPSSAISAAVCMSPMMP